MHKVYENDDLMMYFKKRYCHCCGKELQKKRYERIVRKGDPDHKAYCSIGTGYKPHDDILVIGKEYYCPSCNKTFSCDEQGKVIEAQKYYQKKIVTDEEISNTYKNELMISGQNIKKLSWFLLIPIIGHFICTYYIFNGKLSTKTTKGDLHQLTISALLVFIGVALIAKVVLSIFNDIDFINNYQSIFILIPSLVSFNIPLFRYINNNFA